MREQFTIVCSKDLSVYLNDRSPKTLDELVILAKQYQIAYDKKLSGKRRDDETRRYEGIWKRKSLKSFRVVVRCYRCCGEGHRVVECVSRMPQGHYRDGQQGRRIPCCRSCMGAEMTEGMPVATGKVGDKCVEVLCDTGCNEVIIRRNLVS